MAFNPPISFLKIKDMIIETIYLGLVGGSLNQKQQIVSLLSLVSYFSNCAFFLFCLHSLVVHSLFSSVLTFLHIYFFFVDTQFEADFAIGRDLQPGDVDHMCEIVDRWYVFVLFFFNTHAHFKIV